MGGQYIKMILVMLGTQNNSFNRLLEQIDNLIQEEKIQEEVIVQAGYTKYKSKNMEIFDLISKDEIQRYQQEASYVITHGGAGSIITSLKYGKKVIAVPRKHEYGEHVNNHQEEIVELFSKKGYIHLTFLALMNFLISPHLNFPTQDLSIFLLPSSINIPFLLFKKISHSSLITLLKNYQ